MNRLVFEAADEQATDRFGAALAAALPPGTTLALCGTLGAGKTRLVQAIAAALGVPRDEVLSPTFVLCQQYRGTKTINHLDAYRLHDEDEFRELGTDEMFSSDAITVIEWADRVADALPDEYVRIDIEVTGPTSRRFVVTSAAVQSNAIITSLHRLLTPDA
jgi:tRNA threonylcarbamoyladenosine biosynthesis protein TsaE